MCDATASLYMQGAGAVSGALGSYYGAQSNKSSLALQADLAEINARTSESMAQAALFAGGRAEQAQRLQTASLKSSQKVAFAANGIDATQGSAARVLTSTDVLGEIDANTIAANAVRSAWGYRTQGTNYRNEALTRRAASDAISPGASLTSSLLDGAGRVASSWYSFNKAGAFDKPPEAFDPRGPIRGQRGYD